MAVTNVVGLPEVVERGGATEERYEYAANEVIAPGDLIRITNAGTVKLALLTNSTAGPCHGIALETGAVGGDTAPVLLFADDTIISMPLEDDLNPDDDFIVGIGYQLSDGCVTGTYALESVTTNPVFMVTGKTDITMPWTDVTGTFVKAQDTDNNGARVLCRVLQSDLDAHTA